MSLPGDALTYALRAAESPDSRPQVARPLDDLRVPPGNRLEALKGDREGQFSIRTSAQYRVCFRWTAAGAEDVEIVDYR